MADTKHPAEVLADDLDRMWDQLDPVDEWRPVVDASGEMLRRIPALEAEIEQLKELAEFRAERQAQRERRLWQWAHEELSEPLKTRYFNIVANGTADWMEQPVYAQQCNMMKHRAESAEAERDALRAEVERERAARKQAQIDREAAIEARNTSRLHTEREIDERFGMGTLKVIDFAILHALSKHPVADVLSQATGHFVALAVEVVCRNGFDHDKEILIDGGSRRDITIHAKKEPRQ